MVIPPCLWYKNAKGKAVLIQAMKAYWEVQLRLHVVPNFGIKRRSAASRSGCFTDGGSTRYPFCRRTVDAHGWYGCLKKRTISRFCPESNYDSWAISNLA